MTGEETVVMSVKELRRVAVLRQAIERRVTQRQVGTLLGLSVRQVRRLIRRVQGEGEPGLIHRGRGRRSNRQAPAGLKARVLQLYTQHYGDFGPTLAAEKLAEREGIRLSAETLRRWLRGQGVVHFARRPRPHRAWRAREAAVGALVQVDGSHHDWLEGRGPRCVLLAYIDDASSRVWGRFYAYEGTWPALDSFRRYVRRYGVPLRVYAERHTTYKSPAEPSVAEQLEGRRPQSQFGRCLAAVGTELVYAHSPQAKGRVERLFKTLQDRLVKELRLAGIATLTEANRFLGSYLPQFNRRFAVRPAPAANVHRPRPAGLTLDAVLAVKTPRVLRRDWTVAHGGGLYQIYDRVRAAQVLAEERLDGSLRFTHHGRALRYARITTRPLQPPSAVPVALRHVRPSATHPWKAYGYFARRARQPHATS